MQGAAWDWDKVHIRESDPGILFCKIPVIHLEPVAVDKKPDQQVYRAPLYKTSLRWGELSTTGHSTNFVAYFSLPSKELPTHWVRNGVALLCQLDY
mmetsp:Transcript_13248/g.2061  ORF Transcript_13248/g.2061 Transcript_13248/m.2061 type:complete len:96 (-) Transcript_13248:6-293(-)